MHTLAFIHCVNGLKISSTKVLWILEIEQVLSTHQLTSAVMTPLSSYSWLIYFTSQMVKAIF